MEFRRLLFRSQCVDDYLKRGGPVVGLRTATHAFSNMDNPEWAHYSYNSDGPKKEWANGFGKLILGETWVSHYGANHKQASRLLIEDGQKDQPIFRGVSDMFVHSGARKSTRVNSSHKCATRRPSSA